MNIELLTSTLCVDELSTLVAEACVRLLSEAEVEALCALAAHGGRSEGVVVALLSARSASSRVNLLAAWPRLGARSARRRREAARRASAPAPTPSERLQATALPFTLTMHAFERFVERHGPFPSREAATASLTAEASAAAPIRARTFRGQEQWQGPSGVHFVVKRDGRGAPPVCVTVLPRSSNGLEMIAISEPEIDPDRDRDEPAPDSHERRILGSSAWFEPCSSESRRCAR